MPKQRPRATLEYLDPRELQFGPNVRDSQPDKPLIASIKAIGVQEPVVACRDIDGTYPATDPNGGQPRRPVFVLQGRRRALGAIAAGEDTIPVMVYDGTPADADRIIAQHAENTHRAGLTEAEDYGIVQALFSSGLSAGQIAQRTAMGRKKVTAAAAVGASETAQAAFTGKNLTLEQAAALTEFDGDQAAIDALIADAGNQWRFEHTLTALRGRQELAAAKAKLAAELREQGVTILEERPPWWKDLDNLCDPAESGSQQAGEPLTIESHAACPGHAARIAEGWGDNQERTVYPDYYCDDPARHGHVSKYGGTPGEDRTPAGRPEQTPEEKTAERRRVIAGNKAWRAAREVRQRFVTELLARAKPPADALAFATAEIARGETWLKDGLAHTMACQFLGISLGDDAERDGLGRIVRDSNKVMREQAEAATHRPAQLTRLLLAMVLGAMEHAVTDDTWREPTSDWRGVPETCRYFTALQRWGYGLSDGEQEFLTARATVLARRAGTPAQPEPEDDDVVEADIVCDLEECPRTAGEGSHTWDTGAGCPGVHHDTVESIGGTSAYI